jgi:hypothetical protein
MSLFLVDIVQPALDEAVKSLKSISGVGEVHAMKVDVGKVDEVVALREKVLDVFGEVSQGVVDEGDDMLMFWIRVGTYSAKQCGDFETLSCVFVESVIRGITGELGLCP